MLRIHDVEEIAMGARGLRAAEPQEACRLERVVQDRQEALLQRRLEVDEQVAAGDEIDARKRRVLEDAVAGEEDNVAQFLPHVIMIALA